MTPIDVMAAYGRQDRVTLLIQNLIQKGSPFLPNTDTMPLKCGLSVGGASSVNCQYWQQLTMLIDVYNGVLARTSLVILEIFAILLKNPEEKTKEESKALATLYWVFCSAALMFCRISFAHSEKKPRLKYPLEKTSVLISICEKKPRQKKPFEKVFGLVVVTVCGDGTIRRFQPTCHIGYCKRLLQKDDIFAGNSILGTQRRERTNSG